jgi:hypothetical protein
MDLRAQEAKRLTGQSTSRLASSEWQSAVASITERANIDLMAQLKERFRDSLILHPQIIIEIYL